MRCSSCADTELVKIDLTIAAAGVTFRRCPRCDTRTWVGPDGEMSRERVLALVRAGR